MSTIAELREASHRMDEAQRALFDYVNEPHEPDDPVRHVLQVGLQDAIAEFGRVLGGLENP